MLIQTILAGANFRPAEAKECLKSLSIGDQVFLEADPDNEYDSNAVKIIALDEEGNEHFIGFVAKTDNSAIAEYLADNPAAELDAEIIGFESTLKPIVEINLPDDE